MKLSDFHYELPEALIAQEPLKERDAARLMVLDRTSGRITEKTFRDIIDYMREGDCLVLNDTRVIPARLYGRRKTGGAVEIFLLETDAETPEALIRHSRRIKNGEVIELENGSTATVLARDRSPARGTRAGRSVRFNAPIAEILKAGHVPLPPYIPREDSLDDRKYYQTVYNRVGGATAAPTAGLHFTRALLGKLEKKGVRIVYVTLHTSYGSFAPVRTKIVERHKMHFEYFAIDETAAGTVNKIKKAGGRVFAVGTTSTRALETAAVKRDEITPSMGKTNLFIYPGYKFKIVDTIITNFHLPESTLLMLVCAFAGRDFALKAYKKAIESKFRFYSYGDAMFIT